LSLCGQPHPEGCELGALGSPRQVELMSSCEREEFMSFGLCGPGSEPGAQKRDPIYFVFKHKRSTTGSSRFGENFAKSLKIFHASMAKPGRPRILLATAVASPKR